MTFSEIIIYFSLYSLIGWICETIIASATTKKLLNRGFLFGPVCIIYGVCAIIILTAGYFFTLNPPVLFLLIFLIISIVEYITSFFMEKLFNIRWWNYSKFRFNIKGRICLYHSFITAFIGTLLIYFLHPYIQSFLINAITPATIRIISSFIFAVFIGDFIYTINILMRLEDRLRKLHAATQSNTSDTKETDESKSLPENLSASLEKELISNYPITTYRYISSFPTMRHKQLDIDLKRLKSLLEIRSKGFKWKNIKKRWREAFRKTDNGDSFAKGLNFYKLFWIFLIASVLGYVVEMIYCLVRRGYFESRQGLIYGPFSQIYGFGAVLMVLILHRLRKKSDIWTFICSGLIGGLFEIGCGIIQEKVFKTSSWGYDGSSTSIGSGRTSLLYMLFWGVLGVVLIKEIYPRLSRLIERIPNKQGLFFSWILLIFLVYNMLISGLAVTRWVERAHNKTAANVIEEFLDQYFPNEMMEEIYPNMNILLKNSKKPIIKRPVFLTPKKEEFFIHNGP